MLGGTEVAPHKKLKFFVIKVSNVDAFCPGQNKLPVTTSNGSSDFCGGREKT